MHDETPTGLATMKRALALWQDDGCRREARAWAILATMGTTILALGAALTICLPVLLCRVLAWLYCA